MHAVLGEEPYHELARIAEERDQPVSVLIRDAVEAVCLRDRGTPRRREALTRMLSLNAPVGEWSEMEDEIVRGARE